MQTWLKMIKDYLRAHLPALHLRAKKRNHDQKSGTEFTS